jgi:hypothetical protein
MLDHAQLMWASAERRILRNDDPFALCIGLILGQLLVAIEQDDLGPRLGTPGDHATAVRPDQSNVEAGHGYGRRWHRRQCHRLWRCGVGRRGWHRRSWRGRGSLGCLAENGRLARLATPGFAQDCGGNDCAGCHQPENRAWHHPPDGATTLCEMIPFAGCSRRRIARPN